MRGGQFTFVWWWKRRARKGEDETGPSEAERTCCRSGQVGRGEDRGGAVNVRRPARHGRLDTLAILLPSARVLPGAVYIIV